MKFLIVLAVIVGCAVARPQRPQAANVRSGDVQILRSEYENPGDGTYQYVYELSDGTVVEERGQLKAANQDNPEGIQETSGSYRFVAPDNGQTYSISYTANELGYQPQGEHLPTPPPIPEAIVRATAILFKNAGDQVRGSPAAAASRPAASFRPAPRPRF